MAEMLDAVLRHLEALVSFDTRNPPRLIGTGGIFDYIRAQLPDFKIEVVDHGEGAVSLFAVRGKPTRVFNVHLDTVPSSEAWTADPHVMRRFEDRVVGLGVCDIKGAAAGLIAAANATQGDAAFLFSSDEEANDPRCIAAFLAGDHGFSEAIIAEPTRCEAVLAHRGISSVLMKFKGEAGHASGAHALSANALHQAMRWGGQALDLVFGGNGQRFTIALNGDWAYFEGSALPNDYGHGTWSLSAGPVGPNDRQLPEPSSMALMGIALAATRYLNRRKR